MGRTRPFHVLSPEVIPNWYYFNGIVQLTMAFLFLPEMFLAMSKGWTSSVCSTGSLYAGRISGTVAALWVVSKATDLLETLLLVMDGRRPLMIHVVHHAFSLLFAFTYHNYHFAFLRWIIFLNLCAHVILYAYLSPRPFCFLRPCWLTVCAAQMIQLIIPFVAVVTATKTLAQGEPCHASVFHLAVAQLGLAFFLVLFADFYYERIVKYGRQRKRLLREDRRKKEIVGMNIRSSQTQSCSARSSSENSDEQ
ncbi:unnamed protein product [Caenorhabditis auriculariae]|uniref:Very-long-chain 3-oxoacyl-CoA synthase n=1 Tax=Caenorhabditis auriculariae TaxID=2777116 RepID=A0A8S1HM53_9PELO|nr:unnamed protein product [Caenorhabditis auriculariae]